MLYCHVNFTETSSSSICFNALGVANAIITNKITFTFLAYPALLDTQGALKTFRYGGVSPIFLG